MKLIRRRTVLPQDRRIRLATDYNSGMPIKDIMKRYNVSESTVHNILNELVTDEEIADRNGA